MAQCTLSNVTNLFLGDKSLAKDISGIIAVCEDLREIRARVAYDIKKLSKFTGDGGSKGETAQDNEPNLFYDSDFEYGHNDASLAHAPSENVDSVNFDSLSAGSVDLNSDDAIDEKNRSEM
ncbi:uncharacterized protein N7479_004191 [Penicillium vulpinum]|uniref:Uncharacterized protein n=1 Tax=Penicillium vulpinum TaxID=29845 RepID=A0A1V6SD19_9EURO|nr:uncharacterized protein N7479_004191 [Penicillium vulpinum]KAJ5964315.1 hypothetical protein N7479_004191 [Penicillium vulpinum]OQE11680.1 hypothetical protein PENVUL_c002G00253 [Penicillium vulpinum]